MLCLVLGELIGGGVIITLVPSAEPGTQTDLPHEPYPYTTLPIESEFNQEKLQPFGLLAAFGYPGMGSVSFEDQYLRYQSSNWSWLVTRTELQDVINVQWIWKAVEGNEFVIEAWDAYGDYGRTAMIIFTDGKVYQVQYPKDIYLTDFDPFNNFVTVRMTVDYNTSQITDLWINQCHFSNLPIENEYLGMTVPSPFWQMQIFLRKPGTVLVKEMQAWE